MSIAIAGQTAAASRSKTDPIKVGDIAPDFTLIDDGGKSIKMSKDKKKTLLVFYRGYW